MPAYYLNLLFFVALLGLAVIGFWTIRWYRERKKLQYIAAMPFEEKDRDWGDYKFIGEYAATNEAEFFAVISERFFESPASLKRKFPDLYNELSDFYGVDPASKDKA